MPLTLDASDVEQLSQDLAHVLAHVGELQRVVSNIEAAVADDVGWVAVDNLRTIKGHAANVLLAIGGLTIDAHRAEANLRTV